MPNMGPAGWASLAQGVRMRDRASEEELARLFHPHLLALAASRLGDRETAREIAQEAILAVLEALWEGRVREPGKLPAFVVGTGRNMIRDYLRRKGRRPKPLSLGSDDASISDPASGPCETPPLEKKEERDGVFEALRELKPADREILFLTLAKGLSPREIAVEIGLKSETVRLRKSRALKRLRRKLKSLTRKGLLDHI